LVGFRSSCRISNDKCEIALKHQCPLGLIRFHPNRALGSVDFAEKPIKEEFGTLTRSRLSLNLPGKLRELVWLSQKGSQRDWMPASTAWVSQTRLAAWLT